MKTPRSIACFVGAALLLTGQAATVAAGFSDVLDTPALPSPLAASVLLNGVTRADTRLVAVGQRGHAVYSDDRGGSWTQARVPVSSDLVAVTCPSARRCWAVGHDGVVLASSDGGSNWTRQFDGRTAALTMVQHFREQLAHAQAAQAPMAQQFLDEAQHYVEQGPDKPFLDVWFDSETSGWIVGAFNLIFHTADGGKTWEPWFDRVDNPKRLHLYAIRPAGSELYVVGEQGLVLKLDRQAQRFEALNVGYDGTLFGVLGTAHAVLAFGLRGNVFRSEDAGAHWHKIETGVQVSLTGGTVTADGRLVLVSQAGDVLISRDDGLSFQAIKRQQALPAAAVVAVDDKTLAIAGLRGVAVQTTE